MMGEQLKELFGLTYWAIRKNLEGITHQESLGGPDPSGNCMNWVLGHILQNRDRMLGLLDREPVWEEADSQRYARGTPPIDPSESVADFEEMVRLLEVSQDRVLSALGDEEGLSRESGESTLGNRLFAFNFHESYHAGQLGLLRRLVGREGAIP